MDTDTALVVGLVLTLFAVAVTVKPISNPWLQTVVAITSYVTAIELLLWALLPLIPFITASLVVVGTLFLFLSGRKVIADIKEQVATLEGKVRELENLSVANLSDSYRDLRIRMNELRKAVREGSELVDIAAQTGRYWPIGERFDLRPWKTSKEVLAQQRGFQEVYQKVSTAFSHMERLNGVRGGRWFKGSEVRQEDKLEPALSALTEAEESLRKAIDQLDQEGG